MRSLLAAVVLIALAVGTLVSSSSVAGPPPPSRERLLSELISELSKKKGGSKAGLAAARWYVEVFHGVEVSAPMGFDAESAALTAVRPAENLIIGRACAPLTGPELAAATKVLGEFGEALPVTLRAYTLGSQGKAKDAADLFEQYADGLSVKKDCPGEHPDSSGRRVRNLNFGLKCVKAFDPKRDVTKLEQAVQKAMACQANNHAVG